jgi:two-component system LytT family sensor kinase
LLRQLSAKYRFQNLITLQSTRFDVVSYLAGPQKDASRLQFRVMKIWSETVRRRALPFLRSIGFWMALAILMTWQQHVIGKIDPDSPIGYRIPFLKLLLLFAVRYFTFALLTPPVFYFVRRFFTNSRKPLRGVLMYLLGVVPFVIAYACIRWTIAPVWVDRFRQFEPRSLESFVGIITGTLSDQIGVYIALVIAAHAYEYFKRARTQEVEQHELQQALAASELQALKSQLHPHFLFNTLHGISTLIDTDRVRAKAMIIKLSNLLRTVLQHGSSDLISLQEEVKFLESYLDLEKMRLGPRLEVRWKIDADTLRVLVPQLILQPLVENAILHGIACCREGGWLEIASRRVDGAIEIQIQNSVGDKRRGGMGLGLTNIKARLKYLYSEEAGFSFAINEEPIAVAKLVFPAISSGQPTSLELPTGTQGRRTGPCGC